MAHDSNGVDPPYIAVVGPADAGEDLCRTAQKVGALVAEHGAVVVTGGLGGVMEAAAQGASESGGVSIGLLPGSRRDEANGYLTAVIATGLGELRNALVVGSSDAVIAVGGSWGTMSEVALALRKGLPVVSLCGWAVLHANGEPVEGITVATSAPEAVRLVLTQLEKDRLRGTP